jgi:hypothetical protein
MYLSTANFLSYFKNAYEQKKLAHFYVLSDENHELSKKLLMDLFSYLRDDKTKLQTTETLHPDLSWISTEEESFKVEELAQALKTSIYKPYKLNYRLIVLDHAGKISERLANKLLKTLEEPESFNIYFLLKNHRTPLLPTIQSRSLEIFLYQGEEKISEINSNSIADIFDELVQQSTLHAQSSQLKKEFRSFLQNIRSDESFLAQLGEYSQLEDIVFQSVLNFLSSDNSPYLQNADLKIKEYLEQKKFHMNKEQRVLQLLSELTLKS